MLPTTDAVVKFSETYLPKLMVVKYNTDIIVGIISMRDDTIYGLDQKKFLRKLIDDAYTIVNDDSSSSKINLL